MPIDVLVIHNISLPPGVFGNSYVEDFFSNRLAAAAHPYFSEIAALRVSAHFFIRRSGELVQCVSADQRAWHAGVSRWQGRDNCNDFSIGVELEGTDELAYEPSQYQTLLQLMRQLQARYPIRQAVGHCHIAPGRKTDPGPAFDWSQLRLACPEWSFPRGDSSDTGS